MKQSIWKKRKKNLPGNYAQLLIKDLKKEGIVLIPMQIYDIVRGKVKNSEVTLKVWSKISEMETKGIRIESKVQALKTRKARA